jgi:hypothetical protein
MAERFSAIGVRSSWPTSAAIWRTCAGRRFAENGERFAALKIAAPQAACPVVFWT